MSYDRQCSSCGGFCGRGGCKRENVKVNKQREAMQFALETLEDIFGKHKIDVTAINMLRNALAEPEQEPEFWPGDVLICKEDDSKVRVVNGNRGALQLMNGKIAIAWNDSVGGEYTIEQIKEMFYRAKESEQGAPPARKPLTDSEVFNLAADYYEGYGFKAAEFARAIEQAHGISK